MQSIAGEETEEQVGSRQEAGERRERVRALASKITGDRAYLDRRLSIFHCTICRYDRFWVET